MLKIKFYTRNRLITIIALTSILFIAGSCSTISGISNTPSLSPDCFDVINNKLYVYKSKVCNILAINGAVKLSYINPEKLLRVKVILVRTNNNNYFAFENRCTQCNKELEYNIKSNSLNCIGIGHSRYELNGEVLKGPAKERLKTFLCSYDEENIILDLQKKQPHLATEK